MKNIFYIVLTFIVGSGFCPNSYGADQDQHTLFSKEFVNQNTINPFSFWGPWIKSWAGYNFAATVTCDKDYSDKVGEVYKNEKEIIARQKGIARAGFSSVFSTLFAHDEMDKMLECVKVCQYESSSNCKKCVSEYKRLHNDAFEKHCNDMLTANVEIENRRYLITNLYNGIKNYEERNKKRILILQEEAAQQRIQTENFVKTGKIDMNFVQEKIAKMSARFSPQQPKKE